MRFSARRSHHECRDAWPRVDRRLAVSENSTESAGVVPLRPRAERGFVLAQGSRVRRTWLHGGSGIHGSRKLGDGSGRRVSVWIYAPERDSPFELDGDIASSPRPEAWYRNRA